MLSRICSTYTDSPKLDSMLTGFIQSIIEALALEARPRASLVVSLLDFGPDNLIYRESLFKALNHIISDLPLGVVRSPKKFKGPFDRSGVRSFVKIMGEVLEIRGGLFRDVLMSSYGFIHTCAVLIDANESPQSILDILLELTKVEVQNLANWVEILPILAGLIDSKTEGVQRKARRLIKVLYLDHSDEVVRAEILNMLWKRIDFSASALDSFEFEVLSVGAHLDTISFLLMREVKSGNGGGGNDSVRGGFVKKMVEGGFTAFAIYLNN